MSVSVTYTSGLTVVETLSQSLAPDVAVANVPITHDGFNKSATLNSGSSPPATLSAGFSQAMTAGAATFDLTALVGTNGATVNGNGLKVRALKVQNPATNANPITIVKGAVNGYAGLGASFSHILNPGDEALFLRSNDSAVISGTNKTFDISGTGTQALNVAVVMG